ncbi:hypothetical protein BDB01DRAFT_835677 [Pilobolus umbonatus]|nr:hypothetical protein BDB01DRAFT_835677 [Pilobolus umbonatus]
MNDPYKQRYRCQCYVIAMFQEVNVYNEQCSDCIPSMYWLLWRRLLTKVIPCATAMFNEQHIDKRYSDQFLCLLPSIGLLLLRMFIIPMSQCHRLNLIHGLFINLKKLPELV